MDTNTQGIEKYKEHVLVMIELNNGYTTPAIKWLNQQQGAPDILSCEDIIMEWSKEKRTTYGELQSQNENLRKDIAGLTAEIEHLRNTVDALREQSHDMKEAYEEQISMMDERD